MTAAIADLRALTERELAEEVVGAEREVRNLRDSAAPEDSDRRERAADRLAAAWLELRRRPV